MLSSDDLVFFSIVSGETSLTAAARRLNVSASAVTQRLKALESRIGLRLVQRNGRALVLTDEGDLLARRGGQLVAELSSLNELVVARRGVVSGPLRIIAPFGFGRRYIAKVCSEFRKLYPEVSIDLRLSDKLGRYPETGWDLAIHVGELPSSGLKVRRLARNRRFLCASPDYIAKHGQPRSPTDLREHQCLVLRENDEDAALWRFRHGSEAINVRVEPAMASNDGELLRNWALGGLGVLIRSEWDVQEDIQGGRLLWLLQDFHLQDADVVMLVDAASAQRMRTRKFVQHLVESLSPPPWRQGLAGEIEPVELDPQDAMET